MPLMLLILLCLCYFRCVFCSLRLRFVFGRSDSSILVDFPSFSHEYLFVYLFILFVCLVGWVGRWVVIYLFICYSLFVCLFVCLIVCFQFWAEYAVLERGNREE